MKFYTLKQITKKVAQRTGVEQLYGYGEQTIRDVFENFNKQGLQKIFIIKSI